MISKELLSEVLDINILEYENKPKNKIKYVYDKKSKNPWSGKEFCNRSINIHEFADMCRGWSLDNGYEFVEDINVNRHSIRIYNCGILVYEKFENYRLSPSDTFKACQWILAKQIEEDYQKQQQEDKEEYTKIIKEGVR